MFNLNLNPRKLFSPLCIGFFLATYSLSAQSSLPEESFWSKLRYGGSVGLNISNGNFSGYLAPKAVYDFNRYTSAGVGLAGSYTDASRFNAFSLAGSLIGLLRPAQNIQLSAEFEENYVSRNLNVEGASLDESYYYPALFLGVGYTTGRVTAGVRYDVLYDDETNIYANAFMPFVSFYF